jgi:hypothetical protein
VAGEPPDRLNKPRGCDVADEPEPVFYAACAECLKFFNLALLRSQPDGNWRCSDCRDDDDTDEFEVEIGGEA